MTAAVALVDRDTAGGVIYSTPAVRRFTDAADWVLVGSRVRPHGDAPHDDAVMVEGSARHFVDGIAVCREGDRASCGHPATGASRYHIDG